MICPICDGVVGLTCFSIDKCLDNSRRKNKLNRGIIEIEDTIKLLEKRLEANKFLLQTYREKLNG